MDLSNDCRYGVILYDTNVLGTKGPRKMTVVTPPVTPDGHVQATSEEGMLERVKGGEFGACVKLHNKAPRWNESLGAYCLNFNGRVTLRAFLYTHEDSSMILQQGS